MNTIEPVALVDRLRHRLVEAMLGNSGISHPGLRAALRDRLGDSEALLRDPVFQGAWPYAAAEPTLGELSGKLLHPETVRALSADGPEAFPRDRCPYAHQLKAWETLSHQSDEVRSAVISSGTGSGKTECFLVPMLDDFIAEAQEAGGTPDPGVRAIMLYPLNALIESQKERLDAWTRPLNGQVRYGLYNGDTPKRASARQRRQNASDQPQAALSRPELRERPPQILVTNLTMLEYMMVRPEDEPVLAASRGKLRWIVLDEAHTYVGAAAAEVALLLRRVMNGFGVSARDVRFVATSATIGSGSKADLDALQTFLADIAGVDRSQVTVISGARRIPALPPVQASAEMLDLDGSAPDTLHRALTSRSELRPFLIGLREGFASLTDLESAASGLGTKSAALMRALGRAEADGDALAPMRVHLFQQALGGLWSCIDPDCAHAGEARAQGWTRGQLYLHRRDRCECGQPVLDVLSCNACGETALCGTRRVRGGHEWLEPMQDVAERDEFRFDSGRNSEAEENQGLENGTGDGLDARERVGFHVDGGEGAPCHIGAAGEVVRTPQEANITLVEVDDTRGSCPFCDAPAGRGDKLYPFRFGAPFSMNTALPELLAAMPTGEPAREFPFQTPEKPLDGRQLLSFTDSRQGTARMAGKLQRDSERSFVRAFIYQKVQASRGGGTEDERAEARAKLAKFDAMGMLDDPMFASDITQLKATLQGSDTGLPWHEVRDNLAERREVSEWIAEVWRGRSVAFDDPHTAPRNIAQTLLLMELLRRPKYANSAETLGLARLRSDRIDSRPAPTTDGVRISAKAWREYLYALLTRVVRGGNAVFVPRDIKSWVKHKLFLSTIVPSGQETTMRSQFAWPKAKPGSANRSAAIALLEHGLGLSAADPEGRRIINELLNKAYLDLGPVFRTEPGRQLDLDRLHIAPLVNAYRCPVTRTLLDVAPFGLSPYARSKKDKAEPVTLPSLPVDAGVDAREAWLESATVSDLRERGVWGDLQDRAARFSPYFRTAEHSAQNDRPRLKAYEDAFKARTINVLNCSTTMEMGVDIGGVNGVVMTNLPPAIANYQQRVGRAGRRGQSVSLGYTITKDKPLDREAFRNPAQYLRRETRAPVVELGSEPIVRRHVQAELLSRFLKTYDGDALKMKIGPFMGCRDDLDAPGGLRLKPKAERPESTFVAWIKRHGEDQDVREALAQITRGTTCQGMTDLSQRAVESLEALTKSFHDEWKALADQHRQLGDPGAKTSVKIQLKRMSGEYLLSELADRGFLPGHGFPTGVVSMQIRKKVESGLDRPKSYGGMPSRAMDVAIREFAPGSDIMVDGIVYRSGGVTLNWTRPASLEGVREIQAIQQHAECLNCGHSSISRDYPGSECTICGDGPVIVSEILRPAGFCQDRHAEEHGDVEAVAFVPSEPPGFSAGDAPWGQLPDPRLGRVRASREGRVIHRTRGANELGYGLCLECGRMEPMQPDEEECMALRAGHKPLRAQQGWSEDCPGVSKAYSIRSKISLGHNVQTDVCEISPNAPMTRIVADSVAIAMREALADMLSVESAEIGWAVKSSRNRLGAENRVIGIYDRPTGGAGYSSQLPVLLGEVLNRATALLRCPAECERACSRCILVHDAPLSGTDALDRQAALEFMESELAFEEDLPPAAAAIGARSCPMLVDDMTRRLHPDDTLVFRLHLNDPATLADWSMTPRIREWSVQGRKVAIAVPENVRTQWVDVQSQYMRDWLARSGAELVHDDFSPPPPGWHVAAVLLSRDETRRATYLGASPDILLPDAAWPVHQSQLTVVAPGTLQSLRTIEIAAQITRPGVVRCELPANAAGRVSAFGVDMARRLGDALHSLGIDHKAIDSVHYSDRYMLSPLTVRLMLDTVARLCPGADVVAETQHPQTDRGGPFRVNHNFASRQDLQAFGNDYAQGLALTAKIRTVNGLPHWRRMVLSIGGLAVAQIDLDKGFGWMTYSGSDSRLPRSGSLTAHMQQLGGKLESNEPSGSQAFVYLV